MSGQPSQAVPIVDAGQLRQRIVAGLNDRRDQIGQVIVEALQFEDAAWRAVLKPSKAWPDGYAEVLSEVEELLFDESGVNVHLIPTTP